MKIFVSIITLFIATLSIPIHASEYIKASETTQVVMLGTGTPFNDSTHSGQGIAIVVNDAMYLVDFGPGVMRQINAADRKGYKGFPGGNTYGRPTFVKHAFLTHLDSDHTIGIADIILMPWVLGRKEPLNIYGPPNTNFLVDQTLKAFNSDIQHRLNGAQPATPNGYKVNTTIIKEPGVVYTDENVKVEAFNARHGDWPDGYALGYKFTTPDRVIVISGDTTYDEKVIENYKGADILIHEAYSLKGLLATSTPEWQNYHSKAHTSTKDLATIGDKIKPKLLVLNHILYFGMNDESLSKEFSGYYKGNYVIAKDLDVY